MNWRALALAGLVVLAAVLVGTAGWSLVNRAPAQIVTLPNGMQYRLAGVTYGTNHVMESRWSALAGSLPGPLEKLARRWLGSKFGGRHTHSSTEPTLVVWLKPTVTNVAMGNSSVSVQSMLVDEDGVVSGERQYHSVWLAGTSAQWIPVTFHAWPRRSRTLGFLVFQCDYSRKPGDRYEKLARFRFHNPASGQFPQWSPEPLPVTKAAGDLRVTLHKFASGVGSGARFKRRGDMRVFGYLAAKPGEEPQAAVRFTVESPRGTNESWRVARFFLSDATGNHLKASSWSHSVGRPAHFSPILWPDEAAWKLTVQFKRETGFPESDLLVFRHVPLPKVGQTNEVHLTNEVNGIQCVLESIVLRSPMTNRSFNSFDLTSIELKHDVLPEDFAVDFVSVAFDDPAASVKSEGSSWSGSSYTAEFSQFPTNQTQATITYAVQKTRPAEFLISPNWIGSTNSVDFEVEFE